MKGSAISDGWGDSPVLFFPLGSHQQAGPGCPCSVMRVLVVSLGARGEPECPCAHGEASST